MNDRLETLKKRLTPEMEEAIRAAINDGRVPRSAMNALSTASVEAVRSGQSLESVAVAGAAALDGLEAIVALVGRPPLLIRDNAVELEPLPDLPAETATLIRGVQKWVPSIGRIEFRNSDMSWGGTGWVVEHEGKGTLVVTNRHVAAIVARNKADGTAVFMRSPTGARCGAAIDFGEEVGSARGDNSRTVELTRVVYLADNVSADIALLSIDGAAFVLPTPLTLVDQGAEIEKDELVALIGYPAYDSRNAADAQARYFRDLYEVKRFAPGKVLAGVQNGELRYDCTSLGGNSGSPLIRLSDGKVAGLHFSGLYGKYNAAVSADSIRALVNGQRPVAVQIQKGREEAKDGHHEPSYFEGREGFSTEFLENGSGQPLATPWPVLRADLAEGLATPSDKPDEPNEVRYTHFGVKYSEKLRMPLVTAVNIDGQHAVRIKRADDRWFTDGRIDKEAQLGSGNFGAEIDRGHMVRREDPNWGPQTEAAQANFDTFHYVNAAAQHSLLNQGKTLWQGLENYILDSARTYGFKACVFTGPILREADSDEEEIRLDGAIVPQEFWKVVVTVDEDDKALHATAYILSQGQLIRKLVEKRGRREALEGAVLGAYRTFQVAVQDLADATGHDFGAYVDGDPLKKNQQGREALERGEPVAMPLEEFSDIIL